MPRASLLVVCKNEKSVAVGSVEFETGRILGVAELRKGLSVADPSRCPAPKDVEEGRQMACRRCGGNLWFLTGDGELFAALPGAIGAAAS